MSGQDKIRWGWIKGMYIYTIAGAGVMGLGMLVVPDMIKALFRWPVNEPLAFGVIGSVWTAFGALAVLGLRSPRAYLPLLLLQLCYKSIWFVAVLAPMVMTGTFPVYGITMLLIFATYIAGDLIAIPFPVLFAKDNR